MDFVKVVIQLVLNVWMEQSVIVKLVLLAMFYNNSLVYSVILNVKLV